MNRNKYKREHFDSHEEYDRFRGKRTQWQKKWLNKFEEANPEHRERRLLRCRLYDYYYRHTDYKQSFADWLKENLHVDDLKSVALERLRVLVKQKLNYLKTKRLDGK